MNVIKADAIFTVDNGLAKEFASPFALEKFEKEKRFFENNAWKNQSSDENEARGIMSRGMLWGARGIQRAPQKPRMRYVQRVANRRYYVLELSRATGLFYYDMDKDEEIRLFHREVFSPRGIHVAPDFAIVTTTSEEDGSSHIVRLDTDGRQVKQLTSGDCVDENPFIFDDCVYYQSSGIARTREGIAALFAPSEIMRLNLNSGSLDTIKSYEAYDCLLPKADAQGNIYYIKAPYQSGQISWGTHLSDMLLFPFRLAVAIHAFLNVFSLFFAKRPLKTSGGPDVAGLNLTTRLLHNRVIDIQKTMRKEGKKVAAPSDWRLIRIKNGAEEELAKNVLWYDVTREGEMTYTDGFSVFDANRKQVYESDELVTCVSL